MAFRNRNRNLVLAALAVAAAVLSINGARQDASLSPAAELALRLDAILDQVEEPQVAVSNGLLAAWTQEALPFFEYEGVTAQAIPPDSVSLTPYMTAMEHSHILGRAYCNPQGGGPVEINARVGNPISAWYGRAAVLATLVHELGHIQGGGLCDGSSAELESTTQLVTLEVLASMANGGNKLALYAVLDELRDMAMAAAQFEAIKAKELPAFRRLEAQIYSTASEQARMAKSKRRWEFDQTTLREILYKYSKIPVDKIIRGLDRKAIPNLRLVTLPRYGFDFEQQKNPKRSLMIDDLAYVVAHAEELLLGAKTDDRNRLAA